jgi:hypothetical protein
VARAFPTAAYDIHEAARCLALACGTAAVFHVMRAMEVGVVALGQAVGVRTRSPTWEAVLSQIDRKLDPSRVGKAGKKLKKSSRQRRDEKFMAEANAHLRSVKIAMRNPTMHCERAYSQEEAWSVFDSARVFYQHLSQRLKERPAKHA